MQIQREFPGRRTFVRSWCPVSKVNIKMSCHPERTRPQAGVVSRKPALSETEGGLLFSSPINTRTSETEHSSHNMPVSHASLANSGIALPSVVNEFVDYALFELIGDPLQVWVKIRLSSNEPRAAHGVDSLPFVKC